MKLLSTKYPKNYDIISISLLNIITLDSKKKIKKKKKKKHHRACKARAMGLVLHNVNHTYHIYTKIIIFILFFFSKSELLIQTNNIGIFKNFNIFGNLKILY